MEPRIQYARTADSVDIAYFDVGEGAPLVVLPTIPWSNILAEFTSTSFRFHPRLAEDHRLIRYDLRGAGLSQRGVTDYSLNALQLDLDAVLTRLDVARANLYAELNAARIALLYAATHPDRVEGVILWAGYADSRALWALPRMQAMHSLLAQTDWELYTETVAQVVFGLAAGKPARDYAAYMRSCVSREEAEAYYAADRRGDVTDLLPKVTAPTLLLHPSNAPLIAPLAWGRALASALPNAQLKLFNAQVLWSEEIEDWIVDSIRDFLHVPGSAPRSAGPSPRRPAGATFRAILFTDMERSTETTQRLGDAGAQGFVRQHNAIVREALASHDGSEIKHTGDGIMAAFASASAALLCAVDIQRAVARLNESGTNTALRVKIGLNAGEPLAEDDDLFGTAVQLARRICDVAAPDQVVVPEGVRHLVAGKNFLFSYLGETALRGFEDPVRLYEVQWRE